MPQTGVEPALTYVNSDLNAARLPIPPSGQFSLYMNNHTKYLVKCKHKYTLLFKRTELHGF